MRGLSRLALVAAVCAAAWTRTPVGSLAENTWALFSGAPTRDLLVHYRWDAPQWMEAGLSRARQAQAVPPPTGFSPAVWTAVRVHLGEQAANTLRSTPGASPEAALEIRAIGAPLRDRAIRRARAAGARSPERYESHRRYLPRDAVQAADHGVLQVLALATALDLHWPVQIAAPVTSPYGWRLHPVLGTRRFHSGVDLGVPAGTPILAAGPGRVVRAATDAVNGHHVILDHGHGVTTAYCHGQRLLVSTGDTVGGGAPVMESGLSGRSTGPHLHFGLKVRGHSLDPAVFRPAGDAPSARRSQASTSGA